MSGNEASAETLLTMHDVSVDFQTGGRAVRIVDDVTLSIEKGETLGLVGESGSGKSTVANTILGLLPAKAQPRASGKIAFGKANLLALSQREMRAIRGSQIAMIPQDPMSSLNPLFTIGSQIAEALAAHRARRDGRSMRDTIIELLARVRIDSPATRIDQYPHELSGGMRQRVVGAIAMACSPRLLLADEPTTALDVTVQAQYLDLLVDLQRDSAMAVLLITHDLGVIARICDRVAVMYAGRIVESGSVAAIFRNPRHWYTRALLDSLPSTAGAGSRLASIAGSPLRAGASIRGCRFAPRCPAARDRCREREPTLEPMGDAHEARCWFPRPEPGAPES
jgi:oligopeptide/dipeptide ABC transporter ATP-binding protein